jgi:hypothetical protein
MSKSEAGFVHIVLASIVAVLVVGTGGYVVYVHQHYKATPVSATTSTTTNTGVSTPSLALPAAQSNTVNGVTNTLNGLTSSLNTGESSLNSQANVNDQTSDATVGTAATNLGGAYNASNY